MPKTSAPAAPTPDWGADPDNPSRKLIAAKAALALGADPRARLRGGLDALAMACSNAPASLVELLAPLSDVDATDSAGNTNLHRAARFGRDACARALLAQPSGPAMAKAANQMGETPFLLACARSSTECILALLALSDLQAKDHLGRGALLTACANGSTEALGLLSTLAFDPRETDVDGRDGLQLACAGLSAPCARRMLAHCDPNRKDHVGSAALGIVCANATRQEMIALSSLSWTKPAWDRARFEEAELLGGLIGAGARLGDCDALGRDALSHAAGAGRRDLAQLLFSAHGLQDHPGALASAEEAMNWCSNEELKSDLRHWIDSVRERTMLGGAVDPPLPKEPRPTL